MRDRRRCSIAISVIECDDFQRSVIDAISAHDTASQIARQDMDTMADGLLQAAIAADRALERIADAGIYVDPATGTVKIYGLEQTQGQVTDLQIVLDAVKGQLGGSGGSPISRRKWAERGAFSKGARGGDLRPSRLRCSACRRPTRSSPQEMWRSSLSLPAIT